MMFSPRFRALYNLYILIISNQVWAFLPPYSSFTQDITQLVQICSDQPRRPDLRWPVIARVHHNSTSTGPGMRGPDCQILPGWWLWMTVDNRGMEMISAMCGLLSLLSLMMSMRRESSCNEWCPGLWQDQFCAVARTSPAEWRPIWVKTRGETND